MTTNDNGPRAESRAEQLADALHEIATVNHYMVGLVETVSDAELADAEQILIARQNATAEGQRHTDLGLALDIAENMHRERMQRASRGEPADPLRADLIAALVGLVTWGREHTSPRDANSPHSLLVAACEALQRAGWRDD
ncbi:MAG TPA: hypothetical protein VHT52_12245 [Stellaceae bacterium]|nr:hypothetical protein [Stellaceae bacterium]